MSLLNALAERCVRLIAEDAPDGLGGRATAWVEGEPFDAVLIPRGGAARVEGQRPTDAATFDVVVDAGVALGFHDRFRRVSDGRVFRMTGDTADCVAPGAASVRIARAACERWDAP